MISKVREWLRTAEPGDSFTYFRGYIAVDRHGNPALEELADYLWGLYAAGLVNLVQRRHGPQDYEYLVRAI